MALWRAIRVTLAAICGVLGLTATPTTSAPSTQVTLTEWDRVGHITVHGEAAQELRPIVFVDRLKEDFEFSVVFESLDGNSNVFWCVTTNRYAGRIAVTTPQGEPVRLADRSLKHIDQLPATSAIWEVAAGRQLHYRKPGDTAPAGHFWLRRALGKPVREAYVVHYTPILYKVAIYRGRESIARKVEFPTIKLNLPAPPQAHSATPAPTTAVVQGTNALTFLWQAHSATPARRHWPAWVIGCAALAAVVLSVVGAKWWLSARKKDRQGPAKGATS